MVAAKSPAVRRAATAVAAVGCAVAMVTGCGAAGGVDAKAAAGGTADPTVLVANAADALVRAGSARVATSMRMASGGTWVTAGGTGAFDFVRRQGRVTLELPRDAAGTEEHKPVTEVFTPGELYMKDRGAGVPAGKWVRVDTAGLTDGNLVSGGATEPLAAAELLRGARGVVLAGRERLAGVAVTHVRGTADIALAARAAPSAGTLSAAARGLAVTRVPFEAWFDAEGRVRRVRETFTIGSAGGAAVSVTSTTSYADFGVAVSVSLPRGADIWTGKIVSPPT
jgi:hypothetical protein